MMIQPGCTKTSGSASATYCVVRFRETSGGFLQELVAKPHNFLPVSIAMGSTTSRAFDLPTVSSQSQVNACASLPTVQLPRYFESRAARVAPPAQPAGIVQHSAELQQVLEHDFIVPSRPDAAHHDESSSVSTSSTPSTPERAASNPFSLFRTIEKDNHLQNSFVDVEVAVRRETDAQSLDARAGSRRFRYRPSYAQTPHLVPALEGAALHGRRRRSLSPSFGYLQASVFVPPHGSVEPVALATDAPVETSQPAAAVVDDSMLCVVCLEAPRSAALIHGATAHLCCCMTCAAALSLCPMCRAPIQTVVQTFL
jgi:hypothetical protein